MKLIPFLVVFPLLEIVLFVSVSNLIGLFKVLLITFGTAFFGLLMVRKKATSIFDIFSKNHKSVENMNMNFFSDSFFVLVSGFLFITPGFITDFLGLMLLSSAFREFLKKLLIKHFASSFDIKNSKKDSKKDVIDAEYEEMK